MQRMRPNIPPKPIQTNILPRRPTPRKLKHTRRNPQPLISSHHLRARNPLRKLSPLPLANLAILPILSIDFSSLVTSTISQCLRGSQVREEIAIAFEDIEFLAGGGLVIAAVRPGAGGGVGVVCCEFERAERDS